MRKLLLVLFVFVLAVSMMLATPVPRNVKKPVCYFPTKVGTKWVYESDGLEDTNVVTKVEESDGVMLVSVGEETKDGKVEPYIQVEVSETGLRQVSFRGNKMTVPEYWLRLPLKVEEEWNYNLTHKELFRGPMRLMAFGPEMVTVPAGKFEAIRVEIIWPKGRPIGAVGNADLFFNGETSTNWYAPGVGLVKCSSPQLLGGCVLKSFTPAKD